jgi:hypothetical protein
LDSLLVALRNLADRGLTAGAVLAFLHHRRIVPLMERPLRIFEMTETADPIAPSTPSPCAKTGKLVSGVLGSVSILPIPWVVDAL